jgi:hypothetical protein
LFLLRASSNDRLRFTFPQPLFQQVVLACRC